MTSSKQLHRLATRPHEYARSVLTGRLPRGVAPTGSLVTLLRRISVRDLSQLVGVVVDSRLGYTGSRRFNYGSQALHWVAPSEEVFGSFPAESWRDKRFQRPLYLEDLVECCSRFPEHMYDRYRSLCRPVSRATAP